MKKILKIAACGLFAAAIIIATVSLLVNRGPKDGDYSFRILTTNDIHGCYFDSTYVGPKTRPSLLSVKHIVDSVRREAGPDRVILLDAGDFLQGDNASYFFNYVDTLSEHVYPRMAAYMGYDAIVLGNHDIEAGHPVYDRVAADLESRGIPVLAGNAIRNDNGKPYFKASTIIRRDGIKIAVLGFDNANISGWLSEKLWSGMTFKNLIPLVQQEVDKVIADVKPHAVIAAFHTGTGNGDGSMLESQGLDLMKSLKGVDFLVCAHDHRPTVVVADSACLINAGSHCRNVGEGRLDIAIKDGKAVSVDRSARLIPVKASMADKEMKEEFYSDYLRVKDFTTAPVGELEMNLRTRDAYVGMSDYVNLVHCVSLGCSPARISFAAPLTFNGYVSKGTILFNDLFTIYPFENQLYVVNMTGAEIKSYLEASYDQWINTVSKPSETLLKIRLSTNSISGQKSWSFVERSYNFDSAAGLVYTVDVTLPAGERVQISSLADGTDFDLAATYPVAMTSYRASGGGGLLEAVGIDTKAIDSRVVEYYPEIRDLIYAYIKEHGTVRAAEIGDESLIGHWSFVPESIAAPALQRDLELLFPKRK